MEWSPSQQLALSALESAMAERQRVMVLVGPAGSGKTTLMQGAAAMAEQLGRTVAYAAPTGKAALRLSQVTGERVTTLHSLLYGHVEEDGDDLIFGAPKHQLGKRSLLIVDEASMVGESLHNEILGQLPRNAMLLYVGDKAQLPPVNEDWGPDFSAPTAELTEIHRQAAGNPIIAISATVRTGGKLPMGLQGEAYARVSAGIGDVGDWMTEHARDGTDAVVLSWTHKVRQEVNRLVRQGLGHHGPLVEGDRVRVMCNNKELWRMNGELLTVAVLKRDRAMLIDDAGEATECKLRTDLIGAKTRAFKDATGDDPSYLHIDFGYGLTVHSSQGSEFKHVAFVIDSTAHFLARKDPGQARRLTYTAVTRARERLNVFDVGRW